MNPCALPRELERPDTALVVTSYRSLKQFAGEQSESCSCAPVRTATEAGRMQCPTSSTGSFASTPRCEQRSNDRIYNETVALIRRPPDGVSIIEICPPDIFRPGKFTRDAGVLQEAYEQGRSMAGSAIARWELP